MNSKMTELAFLRNHLVEGIFTEADNKLIKDIIEDITKLNTPFKELALNALSNCENDINNGNFRLAAQEIQLIHNLPFLTPQRWDSDYFYKIELLSYLEQVEDVERIKKLIEYLAILQKQAQVGLSWRNPT